MARTKEAKPQKGPKKGTRIWTAEGAEHVYRAPYFDDARKVWRVRRRHRLTSAVTSLNLSSESESDARRETQELAFAERSAAEEERKNPDVVRPQEVGVEDALLGRKVQRDGKEVREGGWLQSLDARPATLDGYRHEGELYAKLLGGDRLVSTLVFGDVEKLFTTTWKDLSGRSKILRRGLLVRFFDWCVAHGYARTNLAKKVILPKAWRKEAAKAAATTGQALSREDAQKLLAACLAPSVVDMRPDVRKPGEEGKDTELPTPDHLWWFTFLSLRTGLRSSNIMGSAHKPGLLWKHLDMDAGIIKIPGELMKGDADFMVPMHAELRGEFTKRLKSLGRVPDPNERVLPGDAVETKKSFASALERAGLGQRGFRAHDLRHTFIGWLSEFCPYSVMSQLAGHSKNKTITDRYAHPEIEKVRTWLDKLPPLLSEPKAKGAKKPARA